LGSYALETVLLGCHICLRGVKWEQVVQPV